MSKQETIILNGEIYQKVDTNEKGIKPAVEKTESKVEEKIEDLDEASRCLYAIDSKVTSKQYSVISSLRRLINQACVGKGKQVNNQFIYDKLKEILKWKALNAY